QHQESRFFKGILRRQVALGMKRSRHQLAPAVPVQEVIDRAVAGRMPDRFLVGRLEIVDVQHLPGAGRFGKPREQGFFFGQRHVLVLASAIRLGFEGLDAAVLIGHVRTVHRAQRHAHCRRNRRLGHPTLTQQHHLDALALRRRYLPAQRSFQPPHLGFAAFDHLFSPNQMAQANHTSGEENSPRLSAKNSDSSRYGGSIRNCREGNMVLGDALEGYDEKARTQVEAMIDAERRALARRGQEAEDCSCKTGMFPHLGRRSVLFAAGSALAAGLAPLPMPARAAERKGPAGAVWRESPNDPTKVPGTPIAEDGGYGSRSQFETEVRWRYPTPTTLSSWTMTPLDTSEGIITPSGLHFERH